MKKPFITAAVATVAATNLMFGASLANAATTYTPEVAATNLVGDMTAPPALFNGKVLTLTWDSSGSESQYNLYATDRAADSTVQLDTTLDTNGRWDIWDDEYGMNAPFTSVQFDGKFWMWASDHAEDNYDLFYSDGTTAGTGIVEVDMDDYWTAEMVSTSDGIYFWNQVSGVPDLYYFNGTTATAMVVTDGGPNSEPIQLRDFQGKLSFLSFNDSDGNVKQYTAVNGVEMLVGTVTGMYNGCFGADDLNWGGTDSNNAYTVTSNYCAEENELWWTNDPDTLYTSLGTEVAGVDGAFFNGGWYYEGDADDNNYLGLAKAVGSTLTATHEVTYPDGFTVSGDYLYFAAYNDTNYTHWNLYKMGTDGVIHIVITDWDGSYDWPVGAGQNGTLFFNNVDDTNGHELWVDDADGARLVKAIMDGDFDSEPYYFANVGEETCFGAYTNSSDDFRSLYCLGAGESTLAKTGVDVSPIGTAGILTLILGGGLAIVGRRFAIAKR